MIVVRWTMRGGRIHPVTSRQNRENRRCRRWAAETPESRGRRYHRGSWIEELKGWCLGMKRLLLDVMAPVLFQSLAPPSEKVFVHLDELPWGQGRGRVAPLRVKLAIRLLRGDLRGWRQRHLELVLAQIMLCPRRGRTQANEARVVEPAPG